MTLKSVSATARVCCWASLKADRRSKQNNEICKYLVQGWANSSPDDRS
jgi:hypothetical protein